MRLSSTAGAAGCVAAMVILGGSVTLSQLVLAYPAMTGQAVRYTVAAVILAVIARAGRGRRGELPVRPNRRDLIVLGLLAATGLVAFNLSLLIALRHADPALIGTIVGATPVALALVGPLRRGERPAARLMVAAAVIAAGIAIVHGGGFDLSHLTGTGGDSGGPGHGGSGADATGLVAAFGALAGEVAFSLLAIEVLPRLGAVRVSAYSCVIAVPMLLGLAVAAGEPARWRLPTPAEALGYGYLAVALTVGAFLLWFTGLRRLGVDRAGLFVGVLPVATLVTSSIMDSRIPGAGPVAGVLLVAVGLTLGLLRRAPVGSPAPRRSTAGQRVATDAAAPTDPDRDLRPTPAGGAPPD